MPDIRSLSQKKRFFKSVSIQNYEILQDKELGFNIKLHWQYQDNSVVAFKVYKKTLNKSFLDKKFNLNQLTLERTTSNNSINSFNTILYNKAFYSINSKTQIENSTDKHKKEEGKLGEEKYQEISMLRYSPSQERYSFTDKATKFGETYSYYVSAVFRNLKESPPEEIKINCQIVESPPAPQISQVFEKNDGILLFFGNKKSENIGSYLIYKKKASEEKYDLLSEIVNFNDKNFFFDGDVFPKTVYNYKILSKDIFGNLSLDAAKTSTVFDGNIHSNVFLKPKIFIDKENDNIRIKIINQSPDKIVSARIERKDVWRNSTKFEIKSFNDVYAENNIYFNNDMISYVDRSTEKDRAFIYKITCFGKNSLPMCYTITPPMKPGDLFKEDEDFIFDYTSPKIVSIDTEVISKKQLPAYAKFSLNILGTWSFLLCKINEKEIKIDSVNREIFLKLESGKNNIEFELYDGFENKVQKYLPITVNI